MTRRPPAAAAAAAAAAARPPAQRRRCGGCGWTRRNCSYFAALIASFVYLDSTQHRIAPGRPVTNRNHDPVTHTDTDKET